MKKAADYFYNVYQGDNAALEIHDANGLTINDSGQNIPHMAHRYLYGQATDAILASDDGANVLWGLGDHEGTIRDIVKYNTTTQVTDVIDHRKYDSFGKMTSEYAPATDFIFGYTGQALDKDTGLIDFGHRPYDPAVARFPNEDPSGFSAGDMNLYRYVGNNPLNNTDPSGLCSRSAYGGLQTTADAYLSRYNLSGLGNHSFSQNTSLGSLRTDNASLAAALAATPNMTSLFKSMPSTSTTSQSRPVADVQDALYQGLITQQGALEANSLTRNQLQQAINSPWGEGQKRLLEHSGNAARGVLAAEGIVAASMIPGVGEAMDVHTLVASDSTWLDRSLSAISLGANILTAGVAPNFGAVRKAAGASAEATNAANATVRAAGRSSLAHKAIIKAEMHTFDMADGWLDAGRHSGLQKTDSLVYVLRDKSSSEILKVGETRSWESRFGEYMRRASAEGRNEDVTAFKVDATRQLDRVAIERQARLNMKQEGQALRWDNTRIGKQYQSH